MRATLMLLILTAAVRADEPKKPDKPATPKPGDAPQPRPTLTPEQIVDGILQRMDTNKDGKVSKDEARNRVADGFGQMDTNKDGYLDRAELMAMARRMGPPPGRGPFGGPPGPPGGRADPLDFDSYDKNADGRLTRDEMRATRWAEAFEKMDSNKDGKVDPKEWQQYHGIKK